MKREKIKEILISLTENQELLDSEKEVSIETIKRIISEINLTVMLMLTEYPIRNIKIGDFYS